MFKKLRNKAVISFCIFLLLVVGGTSLTYYLFAEDLYVAKKKKVMNEAFQALQTMEMEDKLLAEHSFFKKYEAESFFVMICDESFQTVYVSGSKTKERIMRNKMKKEIEMYREDAKAELDEGETGTKIILRGKMQQKENIYYVYIYEDTDIISKSVAYASHFLGYELLILIVLGGIFAYIASVRIVKPIEEMNRVTKKIAENNFSVRVKVPVSEDELECLARNINHMAEKIQKDMNELSNYNCLLMKKNRDLAQFEDMRKTFVTNVTHELKTPLAIISSQVQMLQYDESKKEYYYESIMEEIEKMSHMISQLLGDSFLENKIKQQEMERQDVSKLIWNLIPKYEAWFSTKKIKVISQIESGCYAKADPGQIEQAVGNYMMNAYNHTKTGKEVRLSLRREGEDLCLCVYNEGEKVMDKEKIWEKFIQLDRQTKNESRVGLGLYIVKDIVQAHSGQCGVNNIENGAEFWIRIPAA